YTSGSTGKPKGIQHATGGYLLGAKVTTQWVFDLRDEDVFWCTAGVGWVTGHSYVAYGPLAAGATVVLYEGGPTHPDGGRFWKNCQTHGVTVFYTAPTAIRALMKLGDALPAKYDLSRLRLLGTVGEPINPEAWMWYHRVIGQGRCPIVDTWWQTETGAILIAPLPGVTATKPGSCTQPLPGIDADIVDDRGNSVKRPDAGGYLEIFGLETEVVGLKDAVKRGAAVGAGGLELDCLRGRGAACAARKIKVLRRDHVTRRRRRCPGKRR